MYEGMRVEMEDSFKDEELFLSEHTDHMTGAGGERGETAGARLAQSWRPFQDSGPHLRSLRKL